MQNRTAGVIATIVAVLLCGCPGLFMLCIGATFAAVSFVPNADIDIFGSSEPSAALGAGIGGLCLGLVFIVIAAVVAFFSLRRKPGELPGVMQESAPEAPMPQEQVVSPSAETKKISEEPAPAPDEPKAPPKKPKAPPKEPKAPPDEPTSPPDEPIPPPS
jgi:outer membrane biosynthesis protein TonB